MALFNTEQLSKRMAIDKANFNMVITLGVAAFVTIFCLVAAKSVWSLITYQASVINTQTSSINQFKSDINVYGSLVNNYNNFVSPTTNIIGGSSTGSGNNSGNNAAIILDALPDKYDFPALATSVQKILSSGGYNIQSIGGTDEELTQAQNSSTGNSNPNPVAMPFTFSVNNLTYSQVGSLLMLLQNSIRPIVIDSLTINGGGNTMILTVTAHTYYLQAKTVDISQKEVQ